MADEASTGFVKPPKCLQISNSNMALAWKNWMQQYTWFSTATQMNKKSPEIQVATFMSAIGLDAIDVYNSFTLTEQEKKNCTVIQKKFEEHFNPKVSLTFERYTFNKIIQNEGETFEEFLTKIKNQGKKCEFNDLLDSLLRDKIVIGINSNTVREKLLAEDDLSLDKAIKVCRASETATQQLKEIKQSSEISVNALSKYKNQPKDNRKDNSNRNQFQYKNHSAHSSKKPVNGDFDCRRCGSRHRKNQCRAYKKIWDKCQCKGHLSKMCFSNKKFRQQINAINNESECNNDSDSSFNSSDNLLVFSINKANTNRDDAENWYEEIIVNNKKLKMKLDSAAQCNVLSTATLNSVDLKLKEPITKQLIAFGGSKIKVRGEILVKCIVRNKEVNLKFRVVDDFSGFEPILGKSTCEKLKLILRVNELKIKNCIFEGLV